MRVCEKGVGETKELADIPRKTEKKKGGGEPPRGRLEVS